MHALQWAAVVFSVCGVFCLGIAVGCQNRETGTLALVLAGLLGFAAVVFVGIASQI